jgi:hypothetical protein
MCLDFICICALLRRAGGPPLSSVLLQRNETITTPARRCPALLSGFFQEKPRLLFRGLFPPGAALLEAAEKGNTEVMRQ